MGSSTLYKQAEQRGGSDVTTWRPGGWLVQEGTGYIYLDIHCRTRCTMGTLG